jgi:hypothetical protein
MNPKAGDLPSYFSPPLLKTPAMEVGAAAKAKERVPLL